MIPNTIRMYATVQDQPNQGVYLVVGWTSDGQPHLAPIKTLARTRARQSMVKVEWSPERGVVLFHETRTEADQELERSIAQVRSVVAGAESLLKSAA